MKADYETMNRLATRKKLTDLGSAKIDWPEDERMLLELYWLINDEEQKLLRVLKNDCPIGWFKPSWEQAQVLNAWHPEYDPDMPGGYRSVCDFSSVRVGKDLRNGTLVATPKGYTPIEELRVGDFVLDHQGHPTRVNGVYPQGIRQMYRMEFSDGTWIECSEDHLWEVSTAAHRHEARRFDGFVVAEVAEMMGVASSTIVSWDRNRKLPCSLVTKGGHRRYRKEDIIRLTGKCPKNRRKISTVLSVRQMIDRFGSIPDYRARPSLPEAPCTLFTGSPLPINPWILGLILGDGGITGKSIRFSCKEPEIIERMRPILFEEGISIRKVLGDNVDYGLSSDNPRLNSLRRKLVSLELAGKNSHTKFVPEIYKTANEKDRIDLLRGLMDTDGYANSRGQAIFYSVSKTLADDVCEISRSLGCHVTLNVKRGRYKGGEHLSWAVVFRYSPFNPFSIKRKAERNAEKVNRNRPNKFIYRIIESEMAESTCIEVDNPRGLFLLKHGIVTHNTTSLIIDIGLWSGPNCRDWVVYEPYTDHLGREVKVFERFKWDEWIRSGRRIYDESEPPKSACVNWVGCVNENHYIQKLDPAFRKWIPNKWIGRKGRSGRDEEWYRAERLFKTKWGSAVVFKLYDSEMSDWSGEALFKASFDEGPPKDKLDEVVVRSEYIHIAFTPREAANLGGRSALAFKIYKGDDVEKGGQPLIGKKKFFFSKMADTPDFILPEETRQRRLLVASKMGEAGKVAVEGGFFQSSPLVFGNFERARHVIPLSGQQIMERWRDGMILRGFDEGLANPSACTWYLVTKANEWIAFLTWEQSGLSVSQRCEKIVMLSRNERMLVKWNEDETRRIYRETMKGMKVRRTFADSKLFKRNPERVEDNWAASYWNAGLRIERASNIGPAARCDYLNDMMRPDPTRKHILFGDEKHGATEAANGPGCKWYISIDCEKIIERCENYLWQQISTGQRIGEFTEKPATGDDHTVDSFCYPPISGLRWREWKEPSEYVQSARPVGQYSSITGY